MTLVALAVLLICASLYARDPLAKIAFLCVGAALLLLLVTAKTMRELEAHNRRRRIKTISEFVALDSSITFITDAEGVILHRNRAATQRFGSLGPNTLGGVLREVFANPAAILQKLNRNALETGVAQEDVVTRRGHVRLSLTRLSDNQTAWRLEEIADHTVGPKGSDGGHLAMITVGRNDAILFMTESARRLIGERPKTLDRVFPALPLQSGENNQVSSAEGVINCLIVELAITGGRREFICFPRARSPRFSQRDGPFSRIFLCRC